VAEENEEAENGDEAASPESSDERSQPTRPSSPSREDYQERLDRIASIFSGMVQRADVVSLTRCPYKNRFDQCTAKFGCRHQARSETTDIIDCKSDDNLDYRSAWEMNPAAEEKMHKKLKSRRKSDT
jgi:hypothetical protein